MALLQFLRDSTTYSLANMAARGMVFLLLPLYTHALPLSEVGVFEWLSATSLILLALLPLEITQALAKARAHNLPEGEIREQSQNALAFTLVSLGLFSLITFFLAIVLIPASALPSIPPSWIGAAGLLLICNGWLYFVQNELRWSALPGKYALTSMVSAAITAGTGILLLFVFEAGLLGLYAAMITGSACGVIVAMKSLPHLTRLHLNWAELIPLLKFSTPLAVASAAIILATTADRLLVANLLDLPSLGLYGVATRIASVALLALQGFQLAVLPATLGGGPTTERRTQLELSFRAFLLLGIGTALTISATAPCLLHAMAPFTYGDAQIYIPILLVGTVAGATYPFAPGLWLMGRTREMALVGICLTCLGLFASLILIPPLGLMGASLAYAITGLAYGLVSMVTSDRVFPVSRQYRRLLLGLGLFLCSSAALAWMATLQIPIHWRILFVALILPCAALIILQPQELQQISNQFRRPKASKKTDHEN